MKTVAIIPVKYTSSRITSKNMRLLGNMPLFLHTLDKLLKIEDINEVWIDTDNMEIINIAYDYGFKKFKYFIRDSKFADNKTNGNILFENEVKNVNADIYLQILCTSPFTSISSITKCINILKSKSYSSVVGCFKEKFYLWKNDQPLYNKFDIPNSNNLEDTVIESMSLYGITLEEFKNSKLRIGNNPYLLTLEGEETIDINYEKDFLFANKIAIYNKLEEQNNLDLLKLKLNSCILSDLLNELGYKNNVLKNFKMNFKNKKLFGRVKPIQIRELKSDENPNDIYECLKSYESVNYGDIIFVNNKIDKKAYFGDLNSTIAISKKTQGTIINGYTRDVDRINQLDYNIMYKNNTCDDVKGVGTLDFYNKKINIDNIQIYVNNLIFADSDGIVIIPKEIEDIVLNKCKDIIDNEANISNSIISNLSINQILDKYGTF